MSDVEEESAPKRKKGVRNTHLCKRNVIKNSRVHGKSYKSYSGKIVPAIKYHAHCWYVLCCYFKLKLK